MFDEILFVPDLVLPEPALPEPQFPSLLTRVASWEFNKLPCCLADKPLDKVPPQGIVRISGWQSPDTVQMVREEDESVNRKRVLCFDLRQGILQRPIEWGVGQHPKALVCVDRKEVRGTRHD